MRAVSAHHRLLSSSSSSSFIIIIIIIFIISFAFLVRNGRYENVVIGAKPTCVLVISYKLRVCHNYRIILYLFMMTECHGSYVIV